MSCLTVVGDCGLVDSHVLLLKLYRCWDDAILVAGYVDLVK